MSFWKSLFGGSSDPNAGATMAAAEQPGAPRLVFSTTREIDPYELEELCDAVGWARRPVGKVRKALQHSFLVVTLWREQGTYRRLIGFARATSDHAFNATIWDVVLHPEFQEKGLGRALMDRVIQELRHQDISNVTLFADPGVVAFYERLGFVADPEGIRGMFWYPPSQR